MTDKREIQKPKPKVIIEKGNMFGKKPKTSPPWDKGKETNNNSDSEKND
ncbi:MAG: hypothetical protein GX984_02785 [Erysipelothrix sp.]|nr:hypothetical protein [Erysipelothrix sp.]